MWAALFLSVLHSTFFLKDASFQLEFQQSQSVRQNPIGCLPALSLPSGWPRWTGGGAVEAEDMVTWSNLQVTDITEKFMPPPSYSIPACDQSCKRKAKSGQLQFALTQPVPWQGFKRHLHGIYLQPKEKKYLQTAFKNQASITKSDVECSLQDSWFNWANLAITFRKKKWLFTGDLKKALHSGKEWGTTAWDFV